MTPIPALLVLQGWHGVSTQWVIVVGITPARFRIRAITRTRLAGRNRWLSAGSSALVPRSAVRTEAGAPPPEVIEAVRALRAAQRPIRTTSTMEKK